MVTDLEMGAVEGLRRLCKDKVSRDILDVVWNMMGDLEPDWREVSDEFLEDFGGEINGIMQNAAQFDEFPKRKAGDYDIINSFAYGYKEVVLGEHPNPETEVERYLVGFYEHNELFGQYTDCLCGDDYGEIVGIYSQRMQDMIAEVEKEIAAFPYDRTVIGTDSCEPIADKDLRGQIVAIDPKAIKRELVGAERQLWLAEAGFGCSPHGRGRTVHCKNLFTGNTCNWTRGDVLGILKPECMPDWVKARMTDKPVEVLFTFGSSERFPYKDGYVSITAPSVGDALAEFRRRWPDVNEGRSNCAGFYTERASIDEIKQDKQGYKCHEKIDITIPMKNNGVEAIIQKAAEESKKSLVSGGKNEMDFDK